MNRNGSIPGSSELVTRAINREIEQSRELLRARGLLPLALDVAQRNNLPLASLLGRSRYLSVCRARRELMFVLRQHALSYPEIGILLHRDHTTVMYAIRRYERDNPRVRVAG